MRSAAIAGLLGALLAVGTAQAQASIRQPPKPPVPHAPNGPPLSVESPGARESSASAPPSGGDALVENGLGSPMCAAASDLPDAARRSCELSRFVAASYPTGNYAFDVNINTGIGAVGNYGATIAQNFAGFAWMAFVSIAHALIVMLEWCYSFDLLSIGVLGQVTRGLHSAQLSLTDPWLPFALAVAAILVVYHGLIRRRVAQTLGQALSMLAMMAVGLWLIADPAATIGTLDHWSDEAGLGTLAAVAGGSPQAPRRTFASDMRRLFEASVSLPWCYLEFGDVRWCQAAAEPKLRTAALAIARKEQSQSGCRSLCGPTAGPKARTLAASAALLRALPSNGALFLALPANEEARNSTKKEWSLLSVLCGGGGEPADRCSGPTAGQAEFRSEKGTQARLIGISLIWLGGLGMLLLFGFLTLHLLTATIRTLLFLFLAPAAVLAPAFGDGGRSLFRNWGTRLLAAVVSKLIYSFLLGVTLMMVELLFGLTQLGWWGRWIVLSAFWWGAYLKRREIAVLIEGAAQRQGAGPRRPLAGAAKNALGAWRGMLKPAGWVAGKLRTPAPDVEKRKRLANAGHDTARKHADEQVTRTLDRDHQEAKERVGRAPQIESQIAARRQELDRVRRQRAQARAKGDKRRTKGLDTRAQRIEGQIAREQKALTGARERVTQAEPTQRLSGSPHTREQRERRSRFLDKQAALPAAGRRNADGVARDYAALAGLAGYGVEEYRSLDPGKQREARLQIDHELATRSQLRAAAAELAGSTEPQPKRGEQREAEKELQRVFEQRMREEGLTPTTQQPKHGPPGKRTHERARPGGGGSNGRTGGPGGGSSGPSDSGAGGSGPPAAGSSEGSTRGSKRRSTVMEDAFAVAARRKRQLGRDRRT
jgi:hypothetical protein